MVYLDRFLGIVYFFQTQNHLNYHIIIVLIQCITIHICIFKTSLATIITFKTPVSYQILQYIVKLFKISVNLLFQQIFTRKPCFVDLFVFNASLSSTILMIRNVGRSSFVCHVDIPVGILVCHVLCDVIAPVVNL